MRADYDQIADFYDRNPMRRKEVDPDLLDWLSSRDARPPADRVIADVGCGTGNQLVANRPHVSSATLIGIDASIGMLRRARSKDRSICWIHARGERLPIADNSVHYLTNQFSYHHVADRTALFSELYRILRPGGRFVLIDIAPRFMEHRPFYRYFPEAWERDLKDFAPSADLAREIRETGFASVELSHAETAYETDLRSFRKGAEERTACSQLTAISDEAHRKGLARIDVDLEQSPDEPPVFSNPFSTVKIVADK